MRGRDRGEFYELVDLYVEPGPDAGVGGESAQADDWPDRPLLGGVAAEQLRRWWRVNRALTRALALAAAVLLVAAAVVGVIAGRSHTRTTTITQVITDPPLPAGVDAMGCPNGRTCDLRPASGLLVEIGIDGYRNFPVLTAVETFDRASSAIYRREVIARADRSLLRILAECIPSADVPGATSFSLDDRNPQLMIAYYAYRQPNGCLSVAYFEGPATADMAARLVRSFAFDVRVVIA